MNIDVIGWYGHYNVGDEAYKLAFPIVFGDKSHNVRVGSLPSADADLIVLGGGDIVSPHFTNKIKNHSAPKIAASVTITKPEVECLDLFEKIIVRDQSSYDRTRALIGEDKLTLLPDFTFALEPNKTRGQTLLNQFVKDNFLDVSRPNVIVIVNSYLCNKTPQFIARDLITFLKFSDDLAAAFENTYANFIFMPFGTIHPFDDRYSNSWVASRSTHDNVAVMYDRYDVQDTLDIISAANVVVSTRLHSTIFSVISGIPFIDIIHHDKNLGFVQTINQLDWSLSYWNFDKLRFIDLLEKQLASPNTSNIENYNALAKEQLKNVKLLIS